MCCGSVGKDRSGICTKVNCSTKTHLTDKTEIKPERFYICKTDTAERIWSMPHVESEVLKNHLDPGGIQGSHPLEEWQAIFQAAIEAPESSSDFKQAIVSKSAPLVVSSLKTPAKSRMGLELNFGKTPVKDEKDLGLPGLNLISGEAEDWKRELLKPASGSELVDHIVLLTSVLKEL
mmetsp:Transcript_21530/g.24923  ORF Transcript_21530/g.24923 Transcript_21530/m.24923 type:complete len:177 (+) Transcript_21530:286-816(+)